MHIRLAITAITIAPTRTTEGYSSVAAGTAGATDMAGVVDMAGAVDTPVAAATPAAVADMPAVVAADTPVEAVADEAAVAAGSCLLPFLLNCPFSPHGLKGQSISASAIEDHPSAESER